MVCVIKNLNFFVKAVYHSLLEFKENKNDIQNVGILNSHTQFSLQKISSLWPPLKQGSLKSHFLPWNICETSSNCIQRYFAFILKLFFVLSDTHFTYENHSDLLKKIFENNFACVFFWEDIKNSVTECSFIKKYFKSNIPHILCVSNTFFHTRTNTNQELENFEGYLNYLINHGNGLIVFSQQRLFSTNSTIFIPSLFSIDKIKTISDIYNNLSIENVLEPSIFSQKNDDENHAFSTGAFDRLLELLAIGQDFVFSIDNEFSKLIE